MVQCHALVEIEESMNLYFEPIFNTIPDEKKEQVLDSLQVY
jgi:hypothetical protein